MQSAAGLGVLVWGAYAVAELTFLVVRPLVNGYDQMMLPVHWRFLAVSVGAYLVAGAVFGPLAGRAGRLIGLTDPRSLRRLAVMTLAAAYLLNLAAHADQWNSASTTALVVGAATLAGALAGLIARRWEPATRPWADPWTVGVLLAAAPLTAPSFRPAGVGGVLVACAAVFAVSNRVLERGRAIRGLPLRQLVALIAALVSAPVIIRLAEQEPNRLRPFQKTTPAGDRPNVVLIVMDTVRADHMSVYGYHRKTTPWLERFAQGATLYRNAFAASNFTLPSHASMFTGLYPRTHGATNLPPLLSYGEPLDPRFETLAEKLAGQGYLNLAAVANYGYLVRDFGFHQGFHFYDARRPSVCLPNKKRHSLRFGLRRLLGPVVRTEPLDRQFRSAAEINESAFRMLDQAAAAQAPFFLFVNYMDAHDPYIPPPPYDKLFEGRDRALTPEDWTKVHDEVVERDRRVGDRERKHFASQYDGAIAYVDSQIGVLVERLKKLGRFDDTMIIVTADHGEALGEHGLWGHGWSLHQHQVHVPLIIKYPRQRSGRMSEINAGHVDLMPTVLDVVGAEGGGKLHGESLLKLERAAESRRIYAEAYAGADKSSSPRLRRAGVSWALVSADRLKLISSSDGRLALYDLRQDPGEVQDLGVRLPEVAGRLLRELEAWKESLPLTATVHQPRNRLTLERLRALGYIK